MQTHKELDVWKRSLDLVDAVYDATARLPKTEQYNIISQMTRAAVSIPSNIAEGCGRRSDRELIQFLNIARGSVAELETQIIICIRRKWLGDEEMRSTMNLVEAVGKMLSKLVASIKRREQVSLLTIND